ncbi:MAG: hypothetical protein VX265_13025 [Myxococcota bacterium]|nr:hypothetical protein [Myxococcota bacterium]
MRLKEPFRFEHPGVRGELRALHAWLADAGGLEFGSSGDGELTIRGAAKTAYARKFRDQPGWKVTICTGEQVVEEHLLDHIEAVAPHVIAALKPAE